MFVHKLKDNDFKACEAGVSKARGASDSIKPGAQAPGSNGKKRARARDSGRQRVSVWAVARFTGSNFVIGLVILGLAPQALCCRSLRELFAYACFASFLLTLASRAFCL